MKYLEAINEKILKLEKDKGEVLRDASSTLQYLKDQIDKGHVDQDVFDILTKLYKGVSTIDDQLQLLYDVRKEARKND